MTTIDTTAREWARRLEDKEASRSGVTLPTARVAVARRLGVASGTLENIRRGRTKGIRGWIIEKIREATIRQLEQEIMRLSHELELARQMGSHPGGDEIIAAETAIHAARALIEETR